MMNKDEQSPDTVRLTITFKKSIDGQLDRAAGEIGVSKSDYVRMVVGENLKGKYGGEQS